MVEVYRKEELSNNVQQRGSPRSGLPLKLQTRQAAEGTPGSALGTEAWAWCAPPLDSWAQQQGPKGWKGW